MAIVSIQVGAALAVHLFAALGPAGTVFLRVGFSAVLLLLAARRSFDRSMAAHWRLILGFGGVIAAMNLCFYEALARIPLGIAVTIEFLGPLGVAAITSRRPIDFLWIAMAILGVGLLAPSIGSSLDPLGVVFAVLAAIGWAGFVLMSGHVGRRLAGNTGLTLAMAAAAILLFPFGMPHAGAILIDPLLFLGALAVAILSTTIPFSLEFEALKRLPPRTYGVLVTLEPAIAVIVGSLLLDETISLRTLVAVGCVTAAAIGVTWFERKGSNS